MMRHSRYLGRAALFTAAILTGIGTPATLGHGTAGWSLAVKSALADSGRGGDSGRGDDDRGGGDDRSGGGRGRGGNDASGDGADDGGQGRGRGRGGDEAGAEDGGQGRGRGRGGDEAAAAGRAEDEDGSGARGGADGRPEAEVDLSDDDLAGVLAGRRTLVDDRGRVLEVEIEIEDGRRTISVKPHGGAARRNPGPITAVRAVDPQAGITHGVRVTDTTPGTAAAPAPDMRAASTSGDGGPRQVGGDLSRGEEESLIQSGWR